MTNKQDMYESLERLINKYGLWIIFIPIFLVAILVAFAHIVSADGSKVSVLYGLVEYTKSPKEKESKEQTTSITNNSNNPTNLTKTPIKELIYSNLYINSPYAEGYEKFVLGVDVRNFLHDKKYSFRKISGSSILLDTNHMLIDRIAIFFDVETLISNDVIYFLRDDVDVNSVVDTTIQKFGYSNLTKDKLETQYVWKNVMGVNIGIDIPGKYIRIFPLGKT